MLPASLIEPCNSHSRRDCSHGQLGLSSDLSSYVTSAQRMKSKQLAQIWRPLSTIKASCSVDEYVNEFHELVDCAEYTEGVNIVLKFQHGLSPIIQNYIACLTYGRSSDDIPKDWYNAAILCNEITLQTLHSNQLCDPIEPLPSLESEPITTCHRGYQACALCPSPCDSCNSIYWIRIKATTRPPVQWMLMRLKDKAQIQ